MKILLINKFYYLKGGSERYVFDLKGSLEKNGHHVAVFSMQDERNLNTPYGKYFARYVDLNRFNILNIIKYFYNWDAVKRLERLIRDEKPDIAHLNNIAHQLTPAMIRVLKENKVPVVMTLHDYSIACPNYLLFDGRKTCDKCVGGKFYHCALNKCAKGSLAKSILASMEAYFNISFKKYYNDIDLFIAPSGFMKDVTARSGIDREKIKVLHNPIGPEYARDGYGSVEEEKFILYFGRLAYEKGVMSLIESMPRVKGFSLKIAGLGPEYNKLQNSISKSDQKDRIEFVGYKCGRDLLDLISKASAIVAPSIWPENMPYNVVEAMCMGKVVIASDIGGMRELIIDGENGCLFEPGKSIQISQKINDLTREKIKVMGENAMKIAEKLTPEFYYNSIIKEYLRLIN
jgi:glycosyltransferase involved in cell wall biosynthesis